MVLLRTKIETMNKSKKRKISVWVVMALLIGGMIFLVVRDKKIGEANDTPYFVNDTTIVSTVTSE